MQTEEEHPQDQPILQQLSSPQSSSDSYLQITQSESNSTPIIDHPSIESINSMSNQDINSIDTIHNNPTATELQNETTTTTQTTETATSEQQEYLEWYKQSQQDKQGWDYTPSCPMNEIDFEKYEKENYEHLKRIYKPPQISDIVEKIEQDDNVMTVQTYNPNNIPKCNVLTLDMTFLNSWIQQTISPHFIMYTQSEDEKKKDEENTGNGEQNNIINSENSQENANTNTDNKINSNTDSNLNLNNNMNENNNPKIDKQWCRDVQIRFEERDEEGILIDKFRVSKEPRRIKLQGEISMKWYNCLSQMRLNETKWFRLDQEYLNQIGQNQNNNKSLYMKIEVIHVKPLALSEIKSTIEQLTSQTQLQQQQQNIIYENYQGLIKITEQLNNEGKELFKCCNYQQACKVFLKAYSLWRGMTKKLRKTLTDEQVKEFNEKYNQYGANYAQCLINMLKYQECIDFYSMSKLTSSKNIYKLAKCLYELHDYDKAIITLDSFQNPSSIVKKKNKYYKFKNNSNDDSNNNINKSKSNDDDNNKENNNESQENKDNNNQSNSSTPIVPLPQEFEKLKQQCLNKIKQLEAQSINQFYKKIFK